MKNMFLPLLAQKAAQLNPLNKSIGKFVQKMKTFTYSPVSNRAAKRIERFSNDTDLVEFIADTLLHDYPVWEAQDGYDSIHYWYSVALLCFNPSEKAAERLLALTQKMADSKFEDIHLLRRTFDFFKNVPALDRHRQLLKDFYAGIAPKVESIQWIKQIGLDEPEKDWEISFELSTDGERKYDFDLTPEEKDSRLEVTVTVNSVAKGNAHSWWLSMYNNNKTIRALWTRPEDNAIRINDTVHHLPVQPSLLNFSTTLAHMEKLLNAKFIRKPVRVYFTSGLKGKSAIARWMETWQLPPATGH